MKTSFYDSVNTEVLVIGAGYAGVKAAYECCKAGLKVLLIIKSKLCSGSSFYPLMGACACLAPKDEEDMALFLEELEASGAGMSDRRLSEIYISEIGDRVLEFAEIGFNAKKLYGRKACFAKRERDIIYWDDFAGNKKNILDTFIKFSNLTIMEYCDVVHIVKKDNKVLGAVAADSRSRLIHIKTNDIIMATGGYCGLYEHNLNTDDACGLGQIMALEAGAKLINIEFIQFIPGMISPVYKAPFYESTMKYCENVLDGDGNDFLSGYLPEYLTVRECLDSRSGHGPFTCMDNSKYFDIAVMKEMLKAGNRKGFQLIYSPDIYEKEDAPIKLYLSYMKKMHIDVIKDKIMIAPFGHAANGGIFINENCETGVEGLFAAGEVSGGLHGADRIGGLSSGSCFVFGKRASTSVIKRLGSGKSSIHASDSEAMLQFETMLKDGGKGMLSANEVMHGINSTLYTYANIIRTEDGLQKGIKQVKELGDSYNIEYAVNRGDSIRNAVSARHSLKMAGLLMTSMKERKESRGAHYRDDYPYTDNERYRKHIVVSKNESELNLEYI